MDEVKDPRLDPPTPPPHKPGRRPATPKPPTHETKVAAAKAACKQRAAHRQAQQKYVGKNPAAQRQRVAKSQAAAGAKKPTPGIGKHGHQTGRPKQACLAKADPVIDLTGDGHGHHVPGTPYVYSHGWKPLNPATAAKEAAERTKFAKAHGIKPGEGRIYDKTKIKPGSRIGVVSRPKPAAPKKPTTVASKVHLVRGKGKGKVEQMGKDDPNTHRHLLRLSNDARTEIYRANGLTLTHPDVPEHELLDRIKTETDPKIKAELVLDAKRRAEVLALTLRAIERAERDEKRESKRNDWARFDARLRKIKGGTAIINLRNRILSDKVLDRLGIVGEHGKPLAKAVAFRVATGTALAMLFGPLGLGIGILGGAATQELFHHVVESTFGEATAHSIFERYGIEKLWERAKARVKKDEHEIRVRIDGI